MLKDQVTKGVYAVTVTGLAGSTLLVAASCVRNVTAGVSRTSSKPDEDHTAEGGVKTTVVVVETVVRGTDSSGSVVSEKKGTPGSETAGAMAIGVVDGSGPDNAE